MGQRLQLCSPI